MFWDLVVKLKGKTQERRLISEHSCRGFGQIPPLSLQDLYVYLFGKVALARGVSEHPNLHFCIVRETGSQISGSEEKMEFLWSKRLPRANLLLTILGRSPLLTGWTVPVTGS